MNRQTLFRRAVGVALAAIAAPYVKLLAVSGPSPTTWDSALAAGILTRRLVRIDTNHLAALCDNGRVCIGTETAAGIEWLPQAVPFAGCDREVLA